MKAALLEWDLWAARHDAARVGRVCQGQHADVAPLLQAPRLVGSVHDELLVEVDAAGCQLGEHGEVLVPGPELTRVVQVLREIMEQRAAARLGVCVPLPVRIACGQRWGSLVPLS